MRFSSAKEAIIMAYGAMGLSQAIGLESQDTGELGLALVCPFCKQSGTTRDIDKEELERDKGRPKNKYRCSSCEERYVRPLKRKVHGTINFGTTVSRSSADWRIVEGCEKGLIQRAVELLPREEESWLMFVLTDDCTPADEAVILNYVVDQLDDVGGVSKPKSWAHAKRVLVLVTMMLEHIQQQEMNGRKVYSKADLARAVGVGDQEFKPRAHWGRIHYAVNVALGDLTVRALEPIDEVIQSFNRRKSA